MLSGNFYGLEIACRVILTSNTCLNNIPILITHFHNMKKN